MYRCQVCGTIVPRGVSRKTVVIQKRARVYAQHWVRAPNTQENRDRFQFRELDRKRRGGKKGGKPRFIEILVPRHEGWEIVKEVGVGTLCQRKVA
jgi:hypothetical protein